MSDHDPSDEPTRVDTPISEPTMAMPASPGGPPPPGEPPPPPSDEPPPPPRDRRWWILGGLVALILAAILVLVLLADDDETASTSDSTTTTEETTTTTEATTTTAAPTTTAPPTTTTTTTTTSPPTTVDPARCVSSAPDEPEPTAEVVYEAFTLGDRGCAENLATAEAINQLFSIPGGGAGWTFEGCAPQDDPDPHTLCSYRFAGGSTGFRMSYSETEGWTVYEVFQVAD